MSLLFIRLHSTYIYLEIWVHVVVLDILNMKTRRLSSRRPELNCEEWNWLVSGYWLLSPYYHHMACTWCVVCYTWIIINIKPLLADKKPSIVSISIFWQHQPTASNNNNYYYYYTSSEVQCLLLLPVATLIRKPWPVVGTIPAMAMAMWQLQTRAIIMLW